MKHRCAIQDSYKLRLFFISIILYLSSSLFLIAIWINKKFGDVSVEQILYHLHFGSEGLIDTDPELIKSFNKWCVLLPLKITIGYTITIALHQFIKLNGLMNTMLLFVKASKLTCIFIISNLPYVILIASIIWASIKLSLFSLFITEKPITLNIKYSDQHLDDYATFLSECAFNRCKQLRKLDVPWIAHAGGAYENATYTNSIEALNYNYQIGHRFFEMNFDITNDGQLVSIHGWEQAEIYGGEKNKSMSLIKFLDAKRSDGLTQLDLNRLILWLIEHPDAKIITDVKSDNIQALKLLKEGPSFITERVIPQIYTFSQYAKVIRMGYKQVIYTNYVSGRPIDLVFKFANLAGVSAITLPNGSQVTGIQGKIAPVYLHTINSCRDVSWGIFNLNAKGFYTDNLNNNDCNIVELLNKRYGKEKGK